MAIRSEIGKKGGDFGSAERCGVALAVKDDVLLAPSNIAFFGADTVVACAPEVAGLV